MFFNKNQKSTVSPFEKYMYKSVYIGHVKHAKSHAAVSLKTQKGGVKII
jgi:hypothetical protein